MVLAMKCFYDDHNYSLVCTLQSQFLPSVRQCKKRSKKCSNGQRPHNHQEPRPKRFKNHSVPHVQLMTLKELNRRVLLDHTYSVPSPEQLAASINNKDCQQEVPSYWNRSIEEMQPISQEFFNLQKNNDEKDNIATEHAKNKFLGALNLIPSNAKAFSPQHKEELPKFKFPSQIAYSCEVTNPSVLNRLSTCMNILCDPLEEFYMTEMYKISWWSKHKVCQPIDNTSAISSKTKCQSVDYLNSEYSPVVVLTKLLKILCVKCARTSFFTENTCYPKCKHLELCKNLVKEPSWRDIHQLSPQTICEFQKKGEIYFFYYS